MPKPTHLAGAGGLDGAALVGSGFLADVYAWGEGRVLKLYRPEFSEERVEAEYAATRVVHTAGMPAPAVYEVMEIDGRCGIVFERVDGVSLLARAQARPWTMFRSVRQLAELQAQIHRCAAPEGLPAQRERIAEKIERSTVLAGDEKALALRQLAELPDGTALCHGDFHPENVLVAGRGPIVIDWGGASRGDPLGDVACTSRLFQAAGLPPRMPRSMHLLLKVSRTLLHRAYLRRSLQLHGGTEQQVKAWVGPIAAAGADLRAALRKTQTS